MVLNDDNDESRRLTEQCYRTRKTLVNPIIDWEDDDVWVFLRSYGCESNPLYKEGFKRIGCVGCPLGGSKSMKREFERWPKYRAQYVRTFDKMLAAREAAGLKNNVGWENGEAVMRWWVGDDPRQILFDDLLEEV